jgi:hypothetical protein
VVAFLIEALADAVLRTLPLTSRVTALHRIAELADGRPARQVDAFAGGARRSLARRLGLVPREPLVGRANG